MAIPKIQPMTEAEYEVWHRLQEERYEYIDGKAQLKYAEWDGPRLMTGARQGHNRIAGNCFGLLLDRLDGTGCHPYISDGKVVTPKGNHRFPDVVIDCGPFDPSKIELEHPTVIIEVLSNSTHWIDTTRKLEEYKSISSIQHIVFLAQDEPRGQHWSRGPDWKVEYFEGMEAEIDLAALNVKLDLAAVYRNAL